MNSNTETYVDFVENMAVDSDLAVADDPWNSMTIGKAKVVIDIVLNPAQPGWTSSSTSLRCSLTPSSCSTAMPVALVSASRNSAEKSMLAIVDLATV